MLVALLLASAPAHAEVMEIGAAVGAGGQGATSYGALELRLDALWRGLRIGLGGRAVWEGGAFRVREWSRPIDAIAVIRHLEAQAGPFAIAAGALAPTTIGHVADAYRATLDDRARTGARAALAMREVEGSIEIDDVLAPGFVGGGLGWQVVPRWGVRAASVVDPSTARVGIELGGVRRWERDDSRVDVGASIIGERWRSGDPGSPMSQRVGLGAVGSASVAFDHAGARWSLAADVRGGTGTNGAAFGPLYRAERAVIARDSDSTTPVPAILDDVRSGIGGGLVATVASEHGWFSLGGRWRPGIGALGTTSAGAPMGRTLQAGGWIAASQRAIAGAAELRAVWATHYSSSLQLARMYLDATSPALTTTLVPVWSATVWFGVSTR